MISTVTTSTVTTLANVSLAGTLGLIAIILLLIFLVQKEISSTAASKKMARWSRSLNLAILPLLIVFVAVVIVRITIALR